MTSLPTNSKNGDTLLQHNPLVLPVCLLVLNSVFLVALCFAVRAWISDEAHKLSLMVAIVAYFVLSTAGLIYHSVKLLRLHIVPLETAAASLLSALPLDKVKGGEQSIATIADACSNEIDNLRYASQLIADYSSDLLFTITDDLKVVELNASVQRALQSNKINVIGTSFFNLVVAADHEKTRAYFERTKASEESDSVLECRLQAGLDKVIDVRWTVEWSRSMNAFYCIGEDITTEKEIQRLRAEITAMVSHDLRAPVSALSFFVDNLSSGDYGELNEKGRTQVSRSRQNVSQLLRLINQLLDAEKLESGEIKADVKIVPVSEIIQSAVHLLQNLAEQKNLEIKVPESESLVHADFDRSVQILSNLLSNAIKFSPENGSIEIRELVGKEEIRIEVRDQGPGVPVANRGELFQRFKSWAVAGTNAPSSGLGLYLAKELAELQGGALQFAPAPGNGSIFTLTMKTASEDELPGYLD
ncbi:MAG: PAS domain-containing sensor histidine kinase [Candidatus Obscuribacterales bacterium]|jgi:PAS domain S-box-containing protein|nr:PAS domain-containing sensor histidine kinase [Candidatus Obscuribacterales bacterium]